MKNSILSLAVLLITTLSLFAQKGKEARMERLEAQKVSFITSKLNLTVEEAQSFWPIYNEYQSEWNAARIDRTFRKPDFNNLTDQQAEEKMENYLSAEEQKVNIRRKYKSKLTPVIGAKKVMHFYYLEAEFKRTVLQEFRDRVNDRRSGSRSKGPMNRE